MKKASQFLAMGLLGLCAVGLNAQAQTASGGPNSRNANVDKEDPNKPNTPQHDVNKQPAPGSRSNADKGAAGESTPTGGDGSNATKNRDVTQPIQGIDESRRENQPDCEAMTGPEKEICEKQDEKQRATSARDEAAPAEPSSSQQ